MFSKWANLVRLHFPANIRVFTMVWTPGILFVLWILCTQSLTQGCGTDRAFYAAEIQTIFKPPYENNQDCSYTILGDGREISLTLVYFDVEHEQTCQFDYVQVTLNNGLYTNRLCGHGDQGPFISTGFTIRFKTDDSVTANGFTAVFQYVGDECARQGGACRASCEAGEVELASSLCGTAKCCVNPLPQECGQVPKSGVLSTGARIVGGSEAEKHSWPWQVSLQDQWNYHFCGGSMITDRWVFTAAHCVNGNYAGMKVVVGEHYTGNMPSHGEAVGVDRIILHENFENDPNKGLPNDVAVIKLSEAITFDDTVQPACIPQAGSTFDTTGYNCWITGWGETRDTGNSSLLQELQIDIVPNSECTWPSDYINDEHLCVMDHDQKLGGMCHGDSGGPLSCQKTIGGPFWVVGAASWLADGCLWEHYPAVYVEMSAFREWIITTIAENA